MNPFARRTVARLSMMLAGTTVAASPAAAQTVTCEPVSQRGGRELGCFITVREDLGALPRDSDLYWHIDAFAGEAQARAAKVSRSTVVQSLGKTWLFTIGNATWRPSGGERISRVGPFRSSGQIPLPQCIWKGCFNRGCSPRSTAIRESRPGTRWRASNVWKPRKAGSRSERGAPA